MSPAFTFVTWPVPFRSWPAITQSPPGMRPPSVNVPAPSVGTASYERKLGWPRAVTYPPATGAPFASTTVPRTERPGFSFTLTCSTRSCGHHHVLDGLEHEARAAHDHVVALGGQGGDARDAEVVRDRVLLDDARDARLLGAHRDDEAVAERAGGHLRAGHRAARARLDDLHLECRPSTGPAP